MSTERTPEELSAEKRQFAAAFVKLGSAAKAANSICSTNFIRANAIAERWPFDPEVVAFLAELRANAPDECALLADRAETARLAWAIATDGDTDRKTQVAALKLYSDLQGFMKAAATPKPVEEAPRVMRFRDHGTDEEHAAKLEAQQAELSGQ